jgi:hypothetical protein
LVREAQEAVLDVDRDASLANRFVALNTTPSIDLPRLDSNFQESRILRMLPLPLAWNLDESTQPVVFYLVCCRSPAWRVEFERFEDVANCRRERLDVGEQVFLDLILVPHQFFHVQRGRIEEQLPRLLEQEWFWGNAGSGTEEAAMFDTLEAEAERGIELLQERRTALISAAVTGMFDVSNSISVCSFVGGSGTKTNFTFPQFK